MKKSIILIAALAFSLAARAQSQDEVPAAVAPAEAASAPDVPASAVPKEVVVRDGKIVRLQHRCEKSSGVNGSRAEHVVQNTISQVSNKTGIGFVLQFLAGGVIGNAAGSAAESSAQNCTTEVRVRLQDESEQTFETVVPASIGRSLRIFHKGAVRIEDGKPSFWFN